MEDLKSTKSKAIIAEGSFHLQSCPRLCDQLCFRKLLACSMLQDEQAKTYAMLSEAAAMMSEAAALMLSEAAAFMLKCVKQPTLARKRTVICVSMRFFGSARLQLSLMWR